MEMSVPRCSSTSKKRWSSPAERANRFCSMARWPELDMGRNSATPCTMPSKMAEEMVTKQSSS